MHEDPGIVTLVELHDLIIDQGDGYWATIEAQQVVVTQDIPHGIHYSSCWPTSSPKSTAC